MFVALAVTLAPNHPSWLVPLGLAAALGLADDVRSISPRVRLIMQVSIGCVAGAIEPAPGRFGWAATALLVVVLVNAVNLIDGMDGLAASVVVVSALGFALVGGEPSVPALAVCGALVGFLVFNKPTASIYLGDSGSYLLGTALALLAACALEGQGLAAWIALPLFVGLPVADTAIAVVRRHRAGRPLLAGDRSHVYDQLADRGWPIVRVLFVCVGLQIAGDSGRLGRVASRSRRRGGGCRRGHGRSGAGGLENRIRRGRGGGMRELAVLGGAARFPEGIPFVRPAAPALSRVTEIVGESWARGALTNGPLVAELERRAAEYLQVPHVVAVSSCTTGLMLALRALDVSGPVVMPSFTFSASAHAVAWNGATPRFAECDPASFQVALGDASKRLDGAGAVLATHVFGAPCSPKEIEDVAACVGHSAGVRRRARIRCVARGRAGRLLR